MISEKYTRNIGVWVWIRSDWFKKTFNGRLA